ncbi:hypothetical protein [Williamsia phyllosphaerae]|uniref:Mce-associated membrane protein n=1 Tax=Williamsia phyllosphaerae TaxID=885042 RepID=A0ABQ1USN0_9NOCA|nr:hypothetical protein [Williamsia phyllosphaerae]GGF24460.1 hypothetical protein GCM10007298_20440 [Williamsia phyllosphaerae]
MTRRARIVDAWIAVGVPIAGVGVVIGLGAIDDWPGWWISLMVLTVAGAIGYGVVTRRDEPRLLLAAAMTVAVVVAAVALMLGAVVHLRADRALSDDRADVRRISGELVCTTLRTGTDADRAAALRVATGELGARLRSGAAAASSDQARSTTRCIPARIGLGAVTPDSADVVVAANLTERVGSDESASGRVIAARLEKVGGTWRVATLDVIR